MSRALKVLRDLVLLATRVVVGVVLIVRGWHRWVVTGLDDQTTWLRLHGVPNPDIAALTATLLELIGGLLLIIGALTPVVGLVIVVEQGLVIAWTKWFRGLSLAGPYGGFEYNLVLGCTALMLAVFGAGRISVDRFFRRPKRTDDPDTGYDEYGPA